MSDDKTKNALEQGAELLEKILKNDTVMQDAKAAIQAAAKSITVKDLFTGKFADKFWAMVRALATFFVVFEQRCLADYGLTEDQVIDILVDKLISWIPPIPVPYIPNAISQPAEQRIESCIFRLLIKREIAFIKQKAAQPVADPVVAAYQQQAATAEAGATA